MPSFIHSPQNFPEYNPNQDHYDGLVGWSDNLSPQMLLAAYSRGIFPWHEENGLFYWFATHPRAVLLPEDLSCNRSLKKAIKNSAYHITVNHCFEDVIAACATVSRRGQAGTWITDHFQAAYTQLHLLGHAHSLECWLPENNTMRLIGGLYGVQIGSVFFGESMFSLHNNASKIALATGVPYLASCGIRLMDCQQESPHMMKLGAKLLPFDIFRQQLKILTARSLVHPIGKATL